MLRFSLTMHLFFVICMSSLGHSASFPHKTCPPSPKLLLLRDCLLLQMQTETRLFILSKLSKFVISIRLSFDGTLKKIEFMGILLTNRWKKIIVHKSVRNFKYELDSLTKLNSALKLIGVQIKTS